MEFNRFPYRSRSGDITLWPFFVRGLMFFFLIIRKTRSKTAVSGVAAKKKTKYRHFKISYTIVSLVRFGLGI